jgi:hypothetical protein
MQAGHPRTDRQRAAASGTVVALILALAAIVASCAGSDGSGSASPTAAPSSGPVVVTFEVAGDEHYKILLTHPDDIAIARQLLAGEEAPGIPNGLVVRTTGVNTGYTWSIDPDDIEFADTTIEVCDGIPSDVEAGVVTSDRYCPWSAKVVAIDPAS